MIDQEDLQPPEPTVRGNPPVFLTSLLGREHEVKHACAVLQRPGVRMLTLVGPGGVGKTRLGLAIAAQLCASFDDGVYFISLAPLNDQAFVLSTIAQQLAVKETGEQPLLDLLIAVLRDKRLLLLLDNLEHLVAVAPTLAHLVAACPRLTLLVTSRAVLRMEGERTFPVPPLALPNLTQLPGQAALVEQPAVALFLQRAQAIQPGFLLTTENTRAIAEICVHLDGLPLAIELAAARIRLLEPYALRARLTQRLSLLTKGATTLPPRQQTLRQTLQWSYDLLDTAEQHLFRLLSVFVGGFTLEAAEAMCGKLRQQDQEGAESVLDGVDSLLEKSLLYRLEQRTGESRFSMLETIHEYGLDCLAAGGELETARQAHAEYYLTLAEQAVPQLRKAEQANWLNQLELEHENLRAALNWLLERARAKDLSQAEQAVRLCTALHPFWWIRGSLREGWAFLEQALVVRASTEALTQARLLLAAVSYALFLQDLERAEALGQESLALCRERGETGGMAGSLHVLGLIARMRFQFASARAFLQEGRELSLKGNDIELNILFLTEPALVSVHQGEYSQAITLLEENVGAVRASEDITSIAWILFCLAYVLLLSKADPAQIHPLLEESLALYTMLGDQWHIAYVLCIQGETHLAQGEATVARTLIEESLTIFRGIGTWWELAEVQLSLARVYTAQGDSTAAQVLSLENLAASSKRNHKPHIAPCLEGLASSLAAQGDFVQAIRLWGAAEALREALGAPIPRIYRASYEQAVGLAREQAGEEVFATTWAEGRSTPLEQTIHNVLQAEKQVAKRERLSDGPGFSVETFVPAPLPVRLTPREMGVLQLLAQGLTNAQIAEQLIIGLVTVNFHVRSIYSKLGVTSRVAATRYAMEHHLL